MKVKLLRAARIRHNAGEIVEVSPAEAGFLLSTGSAVTMLTELPDEKMNVIPEKETPEAMLTADMPEAEEQKETPEAKTPKKATRVKK